MEELPNPHEPSLAEIKDRIEGNPQVLHEAGAWKGEPDPELLEAIVTRQLIQDRLFNMLSEESFDQDSSTFRAFTELMQNQSAIAEQIKTEKGLYRSPAEPGANIPRREPMLLRDVLEALPIAVEQQDQPDRRSIINKRAVEDAIAGNKLEIEELIGKQKALREQLDRSNLQEVIDRLEELQYRIFKLSTEIYKLKSEQE